MKYGNCVFVCLAKYSSYICCLPWSVQYSSRDSVSVSYCARVYSPIYWPCDPRKGVLVWWIQNRQCLWYAHALYFAWVDQTFCAFCIHHISTFLSHMTNIGRLGSHMTKVERFWSHAMNFAQFSSHVAYAAIIIAHFLSCMTNTATVLCLCSLRRCFKQLLSMQPAWL